jgi:hypothetical protein
MAKSCYYSDVIFMDIYICFYGAKQRAKRLKKDIKMISFTDKSVIDKLQFSWNSANLDYYCCSKACTTDKFVTSISDNGSTVVDKRGKCSKTKRHKDIRK